MITRTHAMTSLRDTDDLHVHVHGRIGKYQLVAYLVMFV